MLCQINIFNDNQQLKLPLDHSMPHRHIMLRHHCTRDTHMTTLALLDWAGIALFAATGALTASRKQLDIIGFLFLATITGIGGGTVRDLILGTDVFWVTDSTYILICAASAICVYFTAHMFESRYRLLLWLDALGLAAYGVYGAYKGLLLTGSPVIAVVMGMLTGTLGGILRDVVAGEPSALMRRDIYITAALIGAVGYVVAAGLNLPAPWPSVIGFVLAFGLRSGALAFGWTLPPYKSRPGEPV